MQFCFAQTKFNNEWIIGVLNSNVVSNNNGMAFSRYYDTTIGMDGRYYFNVGANICDSNGRLKLASNGFNILDSNKNYVDGLDSIGGRIEMQYYDGFSIIPQTSLFLPFENNQYYYVYSSVTDSIFINEWINGNTHAPYNMLGYCKVDMNGNGGFGKVLAREIQLLPDTVNLSKTQMMACKHANGKDWWLLKQAEGANVIYKFLFTQDSVYNYGIQGFVDPVFSLYNQGGQSMFSQQGDKYATTCRGTGKIFVADFNRCTGNLSNPKVFDLPELNAHNPNDISQKDPFSEGLAFSPSGRFVYVYMYYNIQQLDLQDNNSVTQWSVVAELDTTWDAFNSYSSSYLGPDNKLYIGNWGGLSKQMSYFNNPDSKGLASGFCPRCLRFPKVGVTTPPCMPNYDLGVDSSLCWPLNNYELSITNDELVVYPNPSSTIFDVRYSMKGVGVEMYNSMGQLIASLPSKGGFAQFDVSYLPKGLYYIKVGNVCKKVVVE